MRSIMLQLGQAFTDIMHRAPKWIWTKSQIPSKWRSKLWYLDHRGSKKSKIKILHGRLLRNTRDLRITSRRLYHWSTWKQVWLTKILGIWMSFSTEIAIMHQVQWHRRPELTLFFKRATTYQNFCAIALDEYMAISVLKDTHIPKILAGQICFRVDEW